MTYYTKTKRIKAYLRKSDKLCEKCKYGDCSGMMCSGCKNNNCGNMCYCVTLGGGEPCKHFERAVIQK